MSKLTAKQRKFCDEYVKSGNASKAYAEAGYSMKSNKAISSEAWKLLRKPHIKAYIEKQLNKLESAKIATAEEVLEYLTSVMRGEQKEDVVTNKGVFKDVPVSAKDRISAAKELLKRYPKDPISKAQLRKINAEADLTEEKVKATKAMQDDNTDSSVIIVDDVEEAMKRGEKGKDVSNNQRN